MMAKKFCVVASTSDQIGIAGTTEFENYKAAVKAAERMQKSSDDLGLGITFYAAPAVADAETGEPHGGEA
jgi:hypothetical protein